MTARFTGYDIVMLICIALALLLNIALQGAVIERSDGVEFALSERAPGGNAPGVERTPTAADVAELDSSGALPGTFVATQGRSHTRGVWPLDDRVEYCDEGDESKRCYGSKPPSSGLHLPVQQNVRLDGGVRIDLPPSPGVYNFEFPREAIPHIQEHAGVFIGYNCVTDACLDAVADATLVVQQELSLQARVVFAPFSDLDEDTFGVASWTRVDVFGAGAYSDERVRSFIKAHSCRFDPENFCADRPVN